MPPSCWMILGKSEPQFSPVLNGNAWLPSPSPQEAATKQMLGKQEVSLSNRPAYTVKLMGSELVSSLLLRFKLSLLASAVCRPWSFPLWWTCSRV